jgi:phosphoserine phosphatase RsbU/P
MGDGTTRTGEASHAALAQAAGRMYNNRWLSLAFEYRFAAVTLLYTVGVLVAMAIDGHRHNLSALLVAVPILAAFERRWTWAAISALVPLVVMSTDLFGSAAPAGTDLAFRLVAVLVATAFAVYAANYLAHTQASLAQSREVAEAAQRAILPVIPDRVGALALSSRYRSSAEESLVGGDFYCVAESPWGTRIVVGDVEGKGLAAVGTSALVLGCFREWAPRLPDLAELAAILDERVREDVERSAFVTAVIASIDEGLLLELANCGHPPPVLARDGQWRTLDPQKATTPFGLGSKPHPDHHVLRPGDRLFFYTDGLTETRTDQGEWVTLDEVIGALPADPFASALDHVDGLLSTKGNLADDLAMLLVEVTPRAAQPQEAGPTTDELHSQAGGRLE